MPHPQPLPSTPPTHIAIIMDGNGRWAKARGLPKIAGHKQGAESVRASIKAAIRNGVEYLTLYAFSSENWNRSEEEVSGLMNLLTFYLGKEIASLHKQGVAVRFIGDRSRLSDDIISKINEAEALTQNNTRLHLQIALSYGGRQEILHAVNQLLASGKTEVTEEELAAVLYTQGIPDPDLLIRTSGEQRISNFLLWQMAYTEFYFTESFWPDFNEEAFDRALDSFKARERRYGG
jgi:undecaprenyl diphosphate synthase